MSEQLSSNEKVSVIEALRLLRALTREVDAPIERAAVDLLESEIDRLRDVEALTRTTHEPSAGVKCTHCNGKGYNEPIYDEQDGWIDETPCETCNGSGRITTVEQYLKTLPANWHEDSSLETWFPITAEELKRLKDERASQPPKVADEDVADARRWIAYLESQPQHEPDVSIAKVLRDLVQFYEWALPQFAQPAEPPNALPLHGVPLDRPIWICSMCHGWNHVQDKHCTHTHAVTKDAGECGACDKPGEHCANVHGICSRHGGRAHETSARRQCGCRTPGCTGCGEFP